MGEVRAQVIASNPLDPDSPELVLDACIDTGAVVVLIGHDIADRLGLSDMGKAVVTLADDTKKEMPRAGPLKLTIGDRSDYFSCLVGAPGCEPLIGQLVLEALDLIVDCQHQTLRTRPSSPAYPSYKMK